MNAPARKPARTRRCLVCLEPFQADGKRRLCGKPICYRVRAMEYRHAKEIKALRHRAVYRCRIRGCAHLAGLNGEYCETHRFMLEPCLRCHVGKRRRPLGAGRPPDYCEACRERPPAKED